MTFAYSLKACSLAFPRCVEDLHWELMQDSRGFEVVSNVWRSDPRPLKAYKIGYMRFFGSHCFDSDYYREHNWDQKHVTNTTALWEHWVESGEYSRHPVAMVDMPFELLPKLKCMLDAGQFEARPHR